MTNAFDFQLLSDPLSKMTTAASDSAYHKGIISACEATMAVITVFELRNKASVIETLKDFLTTRIKDEHDKLKDLRFTAELMMNRIIEKARESGDPEIIAKLEAMLKETKGK